MEINTEYNKLVKDTVTYANDFNGLLEFNEEQITNHKNYGIVYFIYLIDSKKEKTDLVYIGKSKGKLFRTRLRNHFLKKNDKTGAKLKLIKKEIAKGNSVKYKYLKVTPESFRNTLEEELINSFKPKWNKQKGNKSKGIVNSKTN